MSMSAKSNGSAVGQRGIGAKGAGRRPSGTGMTDPGKHSEAPDEAPTPALHERAFGGMSASEAGRKGALVREERKRAQAEAQAAASDGRVVFVRTPVALGDIVARLSTLAAKGDTSAARELRSWLAEYPVEETTDVAALDTRTREALKAELLMRIAHRAEGIDPAAPSPLRADASSTSDIGASGQSDASTDG
jgi:hypothetical protein